MNWRREPRRVSFDVEMACTKDCFDPRVNCVGQAQRVEVGWEMDAKCVTESVSVLAV